MKTISTKDRVQAAIVCVLVASAFCRLVFVSWLAWHGQSTDDLAVLFFVASLVCCVPLWLLPYRRSLRQNAPPILSGAATATVAFSLLLLRGHFSYDLFQPAWHSLTGFVVGVVLYGLCLTLFWSLVGWFFRACRDSITFFPAPFTTTASPNNALQRTGIGGRAGSEFDA